MAEATVGFVMEKIGNLIVQEAISLHGVRDQVKWLENELRRMQCFLKDADQKKSKGDDERVKNWVREMRDLAFETEDIIDTFMYLKLRRKQKLHGCIGFIKWCVFILDELIGRHKIHVDVEGMKTKMRELSESKTSYGIANIGETSGATIPSRSQDVIPISPQLHDDIDIVGFDDEKKKIVQELVDIRKKNRSVISIVGMGGLGKTTLAKSIYNDPEVKRSFAKLAWVIVSREYTILEILKLISSEVSATSSRDAAILDLSVAISKKLKKSKYLVILDDVWEEHVWDQLQKVLPDVNNGSRVIITTRILNIAKIADPTIKPHELRLLNEEESWELFLRKVFGKQDIETCCPIYLVDYAHQLVRRCGRLPLAIVVLGGLVSTKPQTQDAWRNVVESMKWQFVEGGDRCLKILALSYNDLPYYLKSCFLYFGCFREDQNISAQTLIRLWSAEGFLPTKDGKTTEEIGIDCLEELAQRCLIQVTDRRYDDLVGYCRIHDLLRDMCINEAKENKYLEFYTNNAAVDHATMSNVSRRLIMYNDVETLNYFNSKLRVLFFSGYIYDPRAFRAMNRRLGGFKLLRVLYLFSAHMPEFPSEIKTLIHLRYLELHADNLKEVPSWIGHLRNLQTFIVVSGILEKISDSLWRIDSLRHVDVPVSLWAQPPNMRNIVLKNLQTLKSVSAGEWIGTMLPELTNLRKLKIYDVSTDHASALSSSLQKLRRLISLYIRGDVIPSDNVIKAFSNQHCLKKLKLNGRLNCKELPCRDVFPQLLVKLTLMNSNLEQDPMATLENLQFLKYLQLYRSYAGKQMMCSATGFRRLLALDIEYFPELEEWKIEEKAMPCLKYLNLSACFELKVVPEVLKTMPLDELVLHFMPEDWSKIQHVPNFSCYNIHNGDLDNCELPSIGSPSIKSKGGTKTSTKATTETRIDKMKAKTKIKEDS